MKIVFLNVWHGRQTTEIRDFLHANAESTDVFCFQEAYKEFQTQAQKVLTNFRPYIATKDLNPNENYSQVIYVKNNLKVLSEGHILNDDPTSGLANFVEIQRGNQHLKICNFHGVSTPGDKLDSKVRLEQSASLIKFFEDSNIPVIIGGDFNLMPETNSILTFGLNNYKNLILDYKITTTRNHLVWDAHPQNKQLFSDYVFINKLAIVKKFVVPNIIISDHLPLILDTA